jgi:hypothetical protein
VIRIQGPADKRTCLFFCFFYAEGIILEAQMNKDKRRKRNYDMQEIFKLRLFLPLFPETQNNAATLLL